MEGEKGKLQAGGRGRGPREGRKKGRGERAELRQGQAAEAEEVPERPRPGPAQAVSAAERRDERRIVSKGAARGQVGQGGRDLVT